LIGQLETQLTGWFTVIWWVLALPLGEFSQTMTKYYGDNFSRLPTKSNSGTRKKLSGLFFNLLSFLSC
jgi:hypothetical protein